MSDAQSTSGRSLVIRGLAGLLVCVIVLAAGVHLAPVRGLVLRRLLPLAESRAGLRIRAERLEYNLFRLRATVSGVTVAAAQTPEQPFFEAGSVAVVAPTSILQGLFSLTQIEIRAGRVQIVRTASGSNLPQSSSASTSEPPALRLGRIVADLAVDVRDEVSGLSIAVPRMTIDLSPGSGQLALDNGRIVFGGQQVNVTRLAGGAAFDGRALLFREMAITSDVTNARVDGALNLLTQTPSFDLRINGTGDVARLIRLATPTRVFEGDVAFEGTLSGPFGAPEASFRVTSEGLRRDRLLLTNVDVTTRVNTSSADIPQVSFVFAGGRVQADGRVAFDGGGSRVAGTWARVDLARLVSALVDDPVVLPAGFTSGRLSSSGTAFDLAQWTTSAEMTVGAMARRSR